MSLGPLKLILRNGVFMRRSCSPLVYLSSFSTLIFCCFIFSAVSFAAAPDRITGPVISQQFVKLPAGVPRKALARFDQGAVDPSFQLSYMTLLTVPSASQQKAIDQLLAQQQDRQSPLYHKWLTPEQYADRFSLSPNDVQKITSWLSSQGFTIIKVARSRNLIAFSGTAAQAETAFRTTIHKFNVDGESHFSNITPPSIPAAFSGIVAGFGGLNNFRPRPAIARPATAKTGIRPSYYDTNLGEQFLAPADIATIYDVGTGIDGTGQTLAVIGQTDVYLADLADFRTGFSLPAISNCTTDSNNIITACNASSTYLQYVLVNTDPGSPSLGDLPEADLDIEWSGAAASHAQIIYVNAPDPNGNGVWDAWHDAVTANIAPVITMSYTICELGEAENGAYSFDEGLLVQANMQGITFMNSSGDTGAAACDPPQNDPNELYATEGLAVNYPASSPEVTGVGGTMIPIGEYGSQYWNTTGTVGGSALMYIPENAWNDSAEIGTLCAADPSQSGCSDDGITNQQTAQAVLGMSATGGGPSNCVTIDVNGDCTGGFPQPTWQAALTIPGQTTVRFTPDVALLASANFPGYIWCTPVLELSSTAPYDTETASSCASGIAASVKGVPNSNPNLPYLVAPSIVGGTSVSTPVFAGFVAMLNQYVVKNHFQTTPGLGNINLNLYQIATDYDPTVSAQHQAFNQVTAGLNEPGSNTIYCVPGSPGFPPAGLNCPAAVSPATEGVFGFFSADDDTASPSTHYNVVTGLGSVDVKNLFQAWASTVASSFTLAVTATPSSTLVSTNVVWDGTLTALNGYNNNVALTCTAGTTAPPSTCTITPNSLTPTAMGAAFTVTVGSGTAGTYNFNIQGTDGTITQTQAVTLTVNQNFTVPGTLTAPTGSNPGQVTTTTMSINTVPAGGTFTSNVTYTCSSGLPAGATCSFMPPQITAPTSAPQTVTITVQTAGPFTGAAGSVRQGATPRKVVGQKQRLWLPLSLPLAGIMLVGLVGGKLPRRYKIIGLCLAMAVTVFLVACGGGSSSPPPPPTVSVTVSPHTVNTLYPNLSGAPAQTQQFMATVNNSTSQSVTWAVTGGSANGTIDQTGLYTAPTTLPTPTNVTVTATSAAATSPGTATVNLLTPTPSGTFPVTVTIMEGTVVKTTTFSLTVN